MKFFFFLGKNYIEDDNSFFRLNYPQEFIKLATQTPEWAAFFNLCLKFERNRTLIGFVTSFPCKLSFQNLFFPSSEINFLCLERKVRKKRLVSSLIKEETRRINTMGIIQAIYTTGLSFSESIVVSRYFHFPLNCLELARLGFGNNFNFNPKIFIKKFQGIKPVNLNSKHIYQYARFFYSKFKVYKFFDTKNFFYWFKYIPGVTYKFNSTMSRRDEAILLIYSLPNRILKQGKLKFLFPVYMFQIYCKNLKKGFLRKILSFSYQMGFDLFNILEGILDKKFLSDLNFTKGTGKLQFHIFNWKYKEIKPKENGLVLF